MEPEAEDLDNNDNLLPWSGSEEELCEPSEPLAASYNEDDDSESEKLSEPQTPRVSRSHSESPECLQLDCESANDQEFQPEHRESKVSVSCQKQDEIYFSESGELVPESPHIQTSPPEHPDSEPHTGEIWQRSRSSSSSLGSAADMTRALTLSTERPQGTSDRQGPGTGNRRVESSEEGGSSEAPPAPVFFGISDEGAEQAERRNLGSDRDLCRPDGLRARHTRLSHKESQSERHVKETKSKCKRIAQLLANAPNPQNKGALLFKKRRQRVKKYTLVSYGTGVHPLDGLDQTEGEPEEFRSAEYNFLASSDSEFEEQYSLYHQHRCLSLNWGSVQEMEALPETKGKGVMMFAQRRKRMDELVSEHEELMSKGSVEVTAKEPQSTRAQNLYESHEMYVHAEESSLKHLEYRGDIQEMNHLSNMPKPLVPNRTAKPFLGFQDGSGAAAEDMPGCVSPVTKKHEQQFKVSVPKVWSPTGDIIASRDERISIPAIKTGILPETKRKAANKQPSALGKDSELHILNKGDRRSYIESEEDCFSLGAEACNFMQPRTIKLKNPPPVAPKPTINPTCPPWMMRSSSSEPYNPQRSPSHSPVRPHSQHYLQQQDWAQPQQMASHWAMDQTQATHQTTVNARVSVNSSSRLHLQPTTNSWSQQPSQSPVSMPAHSPTYSPHLPSANKSDSAPNLATFCPPQAGKSHVQSSKTLQASPKARVPDRGTNQGGHGRTMAGRGADMFAKRQSRMEKFVIDAETVQANKTRSPSPSSSLPNSWRYSSSIRAPPPVSYNPLLSPYHPASVAKQPPSTSPQTKPKPKEKPKSSPKLLNALDIMKHQPYQLNTSLFTYDATSEAKSPSPKPTPASKFEVTKIRKQRSASSHSYNSSELTAQSKSESPAKTPELVSAQNSSTQSTRSAEPLLTDKHLDETLADTTAAHNTSSKRAPSARPARTSSQHSPLGNSIASAFSPASLIARGVRQMAPRPKFSAKKPAGGFGRSRSLSLPQRLNSSPGLPSPVSTPGVQPLFLSTQRQTSIYKKAHKPPTPWEAASRSPLGSVDEAFMFQSLLPSVASNVVSAAQQKSLPEPPDEWKRRVSLDPPAVSYQHVVPPSISRTFSSEKPAFCGPPFRPAQPLRPAVGFKGTKFQ